MKTTKKQLIDNAFFTDDVVELLNLSSGQTYGIMSQTCDFKGRVIYDVIGMRYKLKTYIVNRSYDNVVKKDELVYEFQGWNHGGYGIYFLPSQFRLVHRPFYNRIKLLCLLLFNKYIA